MLFGLYLGQALPFLQGQRANNLVASNVSPEGAFKLAQPTDAGKDLTKVMEGEGEAVATPSHSPEGGGEAGTEGAAAGGEADIAQEATPLTGPGSKTLKEMLDARQQSLEDDQQALARLMRWSTLSQDEARKILANKCGSGGDSRRGRVFAGERGGAVVESGCGPESRQSVPAQGAGEGVCGERRHGAGATAAGCVEQDDPENSVPKYLAARLAFQDGDTAAAVAFMEDAAAFQHGSLYSAQSAQNRRSALAANGYTNDVASFLAGNSAGTGDCVRLAPCERLDRSGQPVARRRPVR